MEVVVTTGAIRRARQEWVYSFNHGACTGFMQQRIHGDKCTGVGSGGYAGDLTAPTIYVEGILICISPPLEKPNT